MIKFPFMTRLAMNIIVMAALYIGGVWVWQNMIPSSLRGHLSNGARQAVSQISGMIR